MPTLQPKRFLIECPAGLLAAYGLPAYFIEGQYLKLLVEPSDYTITNEQEGETKYIAGFSTQTLSIALMRRNLKIKIKDDRAVIRSVIEELATLSQYSGLRGVHVPLTAIDYARPEYQDVKNAGGGEAHTVRKGIIPLASIESGGIWTWRDESRHQDGFMFTFQELTLR